MELTNLSKSSSGNHDSSDGCEMCWCYRFLSLAMLACDDASPCVRHQQCKARDCSSVHVSLDRRISLYVEKYGVGHVRD